MTSNWEQGGHSKVICCPLHCRDSSTESQQGDSTCPRPGSLTELELQGGVRAEGTWTVEVQRLEGGGAFRGRRGLGLVEACRVCRWGPDPEREREVVRAGHKAMGTLLAGIAP